MNTRQRWQALQGHLAAARAALDRGEVVNALEHVQQALAIDPDFLAAQALRERIAGLGVYPPLAVAIPRAAVESELIVPPVASEPVPEIVPSAVPEPGIDDVPLMANRSSFAPVNIAAPDDVDDMIDVIDLPLVSETREEPPVKTVFITSTTLLAPAPARLTHAPRRERHVGRWAVAAATLAAVVLFASYIDDAITSRSEPSGISTTPLPAATAPAPGRAPSASGSLGTFGGKVVTPITEPIRLAPPAPTDEPPPEPLKRTTPAPTAEALVPEPPTDHPAPAATTATYLPPPTAIVPAAPVQTASLPPPEPPAYLPPPVLPASAPAPDASAPVPATSTPEPAAPASIEPRVEIRTAVDETSIRSLLQRYRSAYDELDAGSASAVWPSVDQRALARAFEGLTSQRLTFDACDVSLNGDAATAICRGSAEYVPKVGSGEPQVEPRTWRFALRRTGRDWTIASARAER